MFLPLSVHSLHQVKKFQLKHLDLAIFLFGPLKLHKKWSYKKKQFISYSAVLSTKDDTPIFLNINTSDPSLVGFKVRFDDETLWALSPIEQLKVYKGYEIFERTKKVNVRKYSPKVISRYSEDTNFRPGFYKQMKSFINRNYKLSPKPKALAASDTNVSKLKPDVDRASPKSVVILASRFADCVGSTNPLKLCSWL